MRSIKEYAKSDAAYGVHQDIAISIHFLVKLRLLSCRFHLLLKWLKLSGHQPTYERHLSTANVLRVHIQLGPTNDGEPQCFGLKTDHINGFSHQDFQPKLMSIALKSSLINRNQYDSISKTVSRSVSCYFRFTTKQWWWECAHWCQVHVTKLCMFGWVSGEHTADLRPFTVAGSKSVVIMQGYTMPWLLWHSLRSSFKRRVMIFIGF